MLQSSCSSYRFSFLSLGIIYGVRICSLTIILSPKNKFLTSFITSQGIMECSTTDHRDTEMMGLTRYHAYSVVGLSRLSNGTMLLRIRNTWGHGEWLGDWRDDDDDNWTESAKREVDDYVDADDGSFYMEISDFCVYFDRLYLGYFVPNQAPRNLTRKKTSFMGRSLSFSLGNGNDGDASLHDDPFPYKITQKGYWLCPYAGGYSAKNPQYLLLFSKSEDKRASSDVGLSSGDAKIVRFMLQIPESQFAQDSRIGHTLSLVAVSCVLDEHGEYSRALDLEGIIKQSTVIGEGNGVTRSATLTLCLSAKVSACIIIPCWEREDGMSNGKCDEGSFKISLESSRNFTLQQLHAKDAKGRGSTKTLDNDLGKLHIVPAKLTSANGAGGIASLEQLGHAIQDLGKSAKESCAIM